MNGINRRASGEVTNPLTSPTQPPAVSDGRTGIDPVPADLPDDADYDEFEPDDEFEPL